MKKTFPFLALILLSACAKLDSMIYNSDTSIEAYLRDDYQGGFEIEVGPEYDIADSLIHPFTLKSDPQGDNKTIHAVYVGAIKDIFQDTVILYCHGNRDHMDYYWTRIKLLANAGGKNRFGVMAMDYRGFGLSEGPASEEGMYEDVNACMNWLRANGLKDERLIMYGYSLGSAPATELTAHKRMMQPSKLILEAPFASDEVMAEDASGLALPGSYFSDLDINVADDITQVSEPFCWIHGVDDDFLRISTHGETVYSSYLGNYSEAHRIEGAGHSDIPTVMGYPEYVEALTTFIARP